MSGLGNRIAARVRGQQAKDSPAAGAAAAGADKNAGTGGTPSASAPNAVYGAALSMLGSEHAAGRLDEDLAAAAARSLGETYREKYLTSDSKAAAERTKQAFQAETDAYRIREKLLGSNAAGPDDNLLSSLQSTVAGLHRLLTAVRRDGESADRRNRKRPIQDQTLPTGWEQSVLEHTAEIRTTISRIDHLVQNHEKAARNFQENKT
jgi:hypothetical protein